MGYVSLLLDADKNAVNIGKSSLIDIFNHQKNTASMIAAVCGNRRVLVKILDAGADPCLENGSGDNILMLVIRRGHTDIAKYLFQLYKERQPVLEKLIDHKNKIGETALLLAAAKGLTSVVNMIVETKKEALLAMDIEGNSALHFAVREGRYEMMSMLLRSSASVNVVNQHSTSLLHLAAEKVRNVINFIFVIMTQCVIIDKLSKIQRNNPLSFSTVSPGILLDGKETAQERYRYDHFKQGK